MADARAGLNGSIVRDAISSGHLKLGPATGPTWRSYPLKAESVGRARRFARDTLVGVGLGAEDGDHCDSVLYVVSELVTNAVIHTTGDRFHLGIATLPRWTHVDVTDPDPVKPAPGESEGLATSGRGLEIVRSLSERFGFTTGTYDKTAHAVVLRKDVKLTSAELAALDRLVSV